MLFFNKLKERRVKKYRLSDRVRTMIYYDRNEKENKAIRNMADNNERAIEAIRQFGISSVEAAQQLHEEFKKVAEQLKINLGEGDNNEDK